ncbi:hypothetical protein [Streptomyces sp. NPDC102264]|uniref:hypothetical protein n=1 Tax=Streptomyces sp. NPDC102264 TaxID=3366149 RepID=UPI0037FFAF92
MNATRVSAAAGVVHAAMENGRRTAAGIAAALESAGLLMSPETAAELDRLSDELTGMSLSLWEEEQDSARLRLALASAQRGRRELRARVAELESDYVAPSPSCTRCHGADAAQFVAQGGVATSCPVCGPSEVEQLRARVAELSDQVKAVRAFAISHEYRWLHELLDGQPANAYTTPGSDAAPYVSRPLPPRDGICTRPECGHSGAEHHHGDTECWVQLPKIREANGAQGPIRICGCSAFAEAQTAESTAPGAAGDPR